jgi:hypothetical protein
MPFLSAGLGGGSSAARLRHLPALRRDYVLDLID